MEITLKITLDHTGGPEIDDPARVADEVIGDLQGNTFYPEDDEGDEAAYDVTDIEVVA